MSRHTVIFESPYLLLNFDDIGETFKFLLLKYDDFSFWKSQRNVYVREFRNFQPVATLMEKCL